MPDVYFFYGVDFNLTSFFFFFFLKIIFKKSSLTQLESTTVKVQLHKNSFILMNEKNILVIVLYATFRLIYFQPSSEKQPF